MEKEMKQTIMICAKLSGLNYEPDETDFMIIEAEIKRVYPKKSYMEIIEAFKYNAEGKWNRISAYQNFCPPFFHDVMNAHKEWKRKEYLVNKNIDNGQKALPEGETKGEKEDEDAYNRMKKQYDEGNIKIELWFPAFRHAEKGGLIKPSKEEKNKLWSKCMSEGKNALKVAKMNGKNTLNEQISLTEIGLKATCAKILLIEYWEKLK